MIAKDLLCQALATVLICQLYPVGAVFTNTTVIASLKDTYTDSRTTHNATDGVGDTVGCVGPTPPTGLSFPTRTWMEVLAVVSGPTTTEYEFETGGGEYIHVPFTATGPTTLWTTYSTAAYPQLQPYTDPPSCCGQCTVYFSKVDLHYWLVPGANTACLNSGIGSNNLASSLATVPPSNNSVSTTVGPDGFTYTSPSVYLAYHDISASNRCGQVGPTHTSVTVAVDPSQLSTLFNEGRGGPVATFDLKQLPCPPQSLIDKQRSAALPEFRYALEVNEWAPIILPPPYIQSLEPAWGSCMSEYVLDPPRTLVPATAMVPSPTPSIDPGLHTTPAMTSATIPTPPLQTSVTPASIKVDPSSTPVDPSISRHPANIENSAHPADPSEPPKVGRPPTSKIPGSSLDPGASIELQALSTMSSIGTLADITQQAPADSISRSHVNTPPGPALPVIIVGSQTLTNLLNGDFVMGDTTLKVSSSAINFHGMTMSLSKSALAIGSSTVHLQSASTDRAFTAAGLAFTALDASNIEVAGTTLHMNGPKGTIHGTVVSLASAGLIIGTMTFAMPSPISDLDNSPTVNGISTLAGHIYPSESKPGVATAGTTVSSNRPDIMISNTVISAAPSIPIIAGQTLTLPTPSPGAIGNTVLIAGSTLTANGSPVTIAGIPLSLAIGPSGLYISAQISGSATLSASVPAGGSVSLNPAGQLVIGGSTVTQATGDGNGGLGSVIMAGFGPASSMAGSELGDGHTTAGTGAGVGIGNGSATASVMGFTGGARRLAGLGVVEMVGLASAVGWIWGLVF